MTETTPPLQAGPAASTRVILVEDNHDLRQGLAEYLRLSGFEVTDVASGVGFYQALRQGRFDIAILDINLPDISGLTLASELAAEGRMGIIMLSARVGSQDRTEGYQRGADLYLTKPVDGPELALAVRNLAKRLNKTPHAPAALVWQLDTRGQKLVSPQGGHVALSGKEMLFLEQFIGKPDALVTRAALFKALGYDERAPETRSLDAMLHRLRQKAATLPDQLPLRVVHALGIRFAGELQLA